MIFNSVTIEDIPKKFGELKKAPCSHNRRRSNMMLNPLKLKHLNRIDNIDADMITLNLEDAIAPSRKKEALHNIALFLSHMEHSNSFIIVRVNPLDEGGKEEIEFLNSFSFDAVRVAKVKTLKEIEQSLAILDKSKELHISLETKEAFHALSTFGVDKRFTTANLGILDLLTSLNLPQSIVSLDNPTIEYILSKFMIDAKIAGIHPISFMYQEYENLEVFESWCKKEKLMGFESKACMGPKQVQIANKVFNTDQSEIIRAKHIKEVFETNSQKGVNGFMDDLYGFIDEPIYRDAMLILKSHTSAL